MFGFNHNSSASALDHEIEALTRRLDKLKRKASKHSHRGYKELKQEAGNFLDNSQEHWQYLSDEGRKLSKHAKQCVEQNPGASLLVGVGALAVLGLLLCRR